MKKIIIPLFLLVTLSTDCMEKKLDQFATGLTALVQSELNTINLETARKLIDPAQNVTQENITEMLEAAKITGQDLSREQLNQAARIIGLQEMRKSRNPKMLSEFVLNYSTEQRGKLRFRLLNFFLKDSNKALEPHDKFYLGWKFLFVEAGKERKNAVMGNLTDLITHRKEDITGISPYHDLNQEIIESKKGTEEYTAFLNAMNTNLKTTKQKYGWPHHDSLTISTIVYTFQVSAASQKYNDLDRARTLGDRAMAMRNQ